MIYFQSLTQDDLAALLKPLSVERLRSRADERMRPRYPQAPELGGETPEAQAALDQKAAKQARYRAKQIFHWVYQRSVLDWDLMSDLSKDTRAWLKANVEIFRLTERVSQQALDGTHKFLWTLPDNKTIESVIIPAALQEKREFDGQAEPDSDDAELDGATDGAAAEPKSRATRAPGPGAHPNVTRARARPTPPKTRAMARGPARAQGLERPVRPAGAQYAGHSTDATVDSGRWSRLTACISSQVGCAMACKFCLTGVQGLDRSLQAHEIVTQVHELRMRAPITNIVFMGMGEPLHNLANTIQACKILLDADGLAFSKRKVTVSTSGLVPAIEELGRSVDVSLAISLNATTDETRSRIMPVNKKWNLEALMKACREFPLGAHRRITFEYVLLEGVNDTLEDAARILKLTRGIPCKLNLIPFNAHSGSEFKRPTDEVVKAFQRYLLDRGMVATVRISRGRDILAACGQLRSIFGTARGTERHKEWASPAPLTSASGAPQLAPTSGGIVGTVEGSGNGPE